MLLIGISFDAWIPFLCENEEDVLVLHGVITTEKRNLPWTSIKKVVRDKETMKLPQYTAVESCLSNNEIGVVEAWVKEALIMMK